MKRFLTAMQNMNSKPIFYVSFKKIRTLLATASAGCLSVGILFSASVIANAADFPKVSLLNTDYGKMATSSNPNEFVKMYNGEQYQTESERQAQNWWLEDISYGGRPLIRLRSVLTDQCLRIIDAPVNIGNYPINTFGCDGAGHEIWIVRPLYGGSSIVLENALRPGHCLEGQSTQRLWASPCQSPYNTVLNQRWILAPARPLP